MRRFHLVISLLFICLSVLAACASCSEQSVPPEPEPPLQLLWSFAYTQGIVGITTVTLRPALFEGTITIGVDGQYTRLSQSEGSLGWQWPFPKKKEESVKKLTMDNHRIYGKVFKDSTYYAVDSRTGQTAWQKTNPEGIFYNYIHDAVDDTHLYLAGDDSVLYVYDKQSGDPVETIRLQHYARAIVSDGPSLYLSQAWKPRGSESAHSRIISLDKRTHEINWSYETTAGGFYYADLVLRDGVLYSGTDGPGTFVALDAATGAVQWELEGYWCYRFTLGDGKIFINDSNYILAVNQQTGEILWKDYFQGHTESNLAYLDGYLYHAHNGGLFIWDAQTGDRVVGPIASPDGSGFYNLNAAGGRVFVQSDYHLYAYEAWSGE